MGASHGKVEAALQDTRDGYTARRSPTHLEMQMLQTQAAIKAAAFNDFHTRRKSLYSV
jgi:hypothetical protein